MNSPFKKLILTLFVISFFSCTEDLYFKQAEDLDIKPVYNSSLTYFTVLPINFFDDNGVLINNSITDSSVIRAFENAFLREHIFQLDLDVICKNEFSRDISIKIEFLDGNGNATYPSINLKVVAENLNFEDKKVIVIADNIAILNTLIVRITTEIEATGIPINASEDLEFELKSALTGYIRSSL